MSGVLKHLFDWLRMANAAMPCRHDQILPVVGRILASLSHCWFVCVFSPVGSSHARSRFEFVYLSPVF
jgi:hypothetical protein